MGATLGVAPIAWGWRPFDPGFINLYINLVASCPGLDGKTTCHREAAKGLLCDISFVLLGSWAHKSVHEHCSIVSQT